MKKEVSIKNSSAQTIKAPSQSKNAYGGKVTNGKDLRVKK